MGGCEGAPGGGRGAGDVPQERLLALPRRLESGGDGSRLLFMARGGGAAGTHQKGGREYPLPPGSRRSAGPHPPPLGGVADWTTLGDKGRNGSPLGVGNGARVAERVRGTLEKVLQKKTCGAPPPMGVAHTARARRMRSYRISYAAATVSCA